MDQLLDEARSGILYLSDPPIANMVVKAVHYNAETLKHYVLHAFAVMPNPVRVGLVRGAGEYRWSSAGWATGASPADQGVRPTKHT
jgi:hypothetical protein